MKKKDGGFGLIALNAEPPDVELNPDDPGSPEAPEDVDINILPSSFGRNESGAAFGGASFGGPAFGRPPSSFKSNEGGPLFGFGKSASQSQKKTRVAMEEAFISLGFTVPEVHSEVSPPRANKKASEDYTYVFLSHARLYVFAEKYDIKPLKMLALCQLHQTLAFYTLYSERIADVIALLRYAYANTSEEQDNIKEDLRPLLTQYIGYEMDALVKATEFKELLEEGGALLSDFLGVVAIRI